MKEYIFTQYLLNISHYLKINDTDLFTLSKKRHIVEARRLLWFLCSEHGMTPTEIKRHTKNLSSRDFQRSTIDRGIVSIKETIRKDPDYLVIIELLKIDIKGINAKSSNAKPTKTQIASHLKQDVKHQLEIFVFTDCEYIYWASIGRELLPDNLTI